MLEYPCKGKKKTENDLFKPMLRYWFPLNRVSCFVSAPSLKSVNFPQFDFPSRGQSTFRATHEPLLNLQQYFLARLRKHSQRTREKRIYWYNKSIACTFFAFPCKNFIYYSLTLHFVLLNGLKTKVCMRNSSFYRSFSRNSHSVKSPHFWFFF